jgi:putative phosphoribosyl transferase
MMPGCAIATMASLTGRTRERLRFVDRDEAGRLLAPAVAALGLRQPVVVALPRGGVPVAVHVARALHAPLDLLLVRKIGAPGNPELAVAALVDTPMADLVVDEAMLDLCGADNAYVQARAGVERVEIERRRALYLRGRPRLELAGREVVVVDDGIATGTTMRAALIALRRQAPARLVLALPVAPPSALLRLRDTVDDIVCLRQPEDFGAVGAHYENFNQVEDDEVVALLSAASSRASNPAAGWA